MSQPIVLKVGGSVVDPTALLDDIATHDGPVLVVHGAHRVLDSLAVSLGHPPRMVTSARGEVSRYTDETAMDHFLMAYCGLVNKRLVQALLRRGVDAVGLAAMDGGTVRAHRREHIRVRDGDRTLVLHGDHAGSIETVDTALLRLLLDAGRTPVICPPAWGDDGVPVNVDGDRLAVEIAVALGSDRVLIFSDAPGFLADVGDPSSVVAHAGLDDIEALLPSAGGRARPKLESARRALRDGVSAVGLCDGTREHPLRDALAGAGSWFGGVPVAAGP